MNILYVGDVLAAGSGVTQKMLQQAREWERQGHRVWLATPREPWPARVDDVAARLRPLAERGLARRAAGELQLRAAYPALLLMHAKRLGVNVMYARELPAAPGLGALFKSLPVVLEVNGDAINELKGVARRWWRRRLRDWELRSAAGVVFVSRELARTCGRGVRRQVVIGNPCAVVAEPTQRAAEPARPTLVFVGARAQPWHGLDKVAVLADLLPELDFVVIGAAIENRPNVRCHERLPQAEADALIRGCTVGIASLAMHRIQMNEASPLKSRNYLALGLPIVQAYEDTDLGAEERCALTIPNREDNVRTHAQEILQFARRAFADPALSREAQELSRGKLSLAHKEQQRLSFVAGCIQGSSAGSRRRVQAGTQGP